MREPQTTYLTYVQVEELRVELNDKIEDMHELEKNHEVVKNEEEKVIQNMLQELNTRKQNNEKDAKEADKLLLELEQVSREKILMLQEEVGVYHKSLTPQPFDLQNSRS